MVRWWAVIALSAIIAFRYISLKSQSSFQAGDRVEVLATVTQEPRESFGQRSLSIQRLLIVIPLGYSVNYGDRILAIGTVTAKVTTTGRESLWLQPDTFQVTPGGATLTSRMTRLRQVLIRKLKSYLPAPEAGLAAGMLFGGTQDLTDRQKTAFRATGISHIVAASGYNVTLVVSWAVLILNRLINRRWAIGLGMIICVLYVLLAGATAAVVRAGVMSILVSIGMISGRPTNAKWILVMTTLLMLLWSPLYLEDIGFQLSIAATAGLVFFQPKGDWWTTIVAQVATMPIILYHFGNLSPIAPVVNILVLWMVPLVMQLTALAVILGLIIHPLGQLMAYTSWPFLRLFNYLSQSFASLTFSTWTLEPVSWMWVVGYYLVLGWLYLRWFARHEIK